jgi:TetR/AcrR family transcriptional regulator, transcriptional repressor for nem operon
VEAPATAKGRRSRELIIETAARLMRHRGIGATPLDDVLSASGTGKSQLYHYFRTKEELTSAVLEYQFEQIMAAQSALREESCADLYQWRQEVLDANRESCFAGCPLGTFAGQVDDGDPLRALFAELFARWQAALTALVTRGQQAGRVAVDIDPSEAALVLLGALQGGAMLSRIHNSQDAMELMLDMALAHVGAVPAERAETVLPGSR